MRRTARWSVFSVFCLLGFTLQAQDAPAACGADYVCTPDASAGSAVYPAQPAILALSAKIAADPRCPAIPVDVIAESSDERHVACSAAGTALELFGQCGIALRRPLRLEILRDVRIPSASAVFLGFSTTSLKQSS